MSKPTSKSKSRRLAVLTEGSFDVYLNKTAMSLLRFCPEDVVCVIDSKHTGQDLDRLASVGKDIPIVANVAAAVKLGCNYLVIGVATPGGYLPTELRPQVYEAIRSHVGIISGLHQSLGSDPNLASLAARYAVELINLRKVSDEEHFISTARARETKAFRVLTVGTDANIGKTTTGLALERYLQQQTKLRAPFVATGQDGILVKGKGVCIDRVIADFASGAVERLVMQEDKDVDLLLIEGQDSILSPPYSTVSLSLLHGSCPDAMILCHVPTRTHHRHTDVPIPPLGEYRRLYEAMLAPLHPGKVVAICLNTQGLDDAAAAAALAAAARETGLPAVDVVRQGDAACRVLTAALLAAAKAAGHRLGGGRPTRAPKSRAAAAAKSTKVTKAASARH